MFLNEKRFVIGKKDQTSFIAIDYTIKNNRITIEENSIWEENVFDATNFFRPDVSKKVLEVLNLHKDSFDDKDFVDSLVCYQVDIKVELGVLI